MADKEKTYSADDVLKAWNALINRSNEFEIREVENFDGSEQTQLINSNTGSIVVAVNAKGDAAHKLLVERAGSTFIHDAITPKAASSADSEIETTKNGVTITPTQPVGINDPSSPAIVNENNPRPAHSNDVPTTVDPTTGGSTLGSGTIDDPEATVDGVHEANAAEAEKAAE